MEQGETDSQVSQEVNTNPRCPNCGEEEFVYRRIPEERSRDIDYKPRRKLKIRSGIFHVAVIYCINCGEIIGTAGGYYS